MDGVAALKADRPEPVDKGPIISYCVVPPMNEGRYAVADLRTVMEITMRALGIPNDTLIDLARGEDRRVGRGRRYRPR